MKKYADGGSVAGQLAKETGTLAPWASGYVGEMLGRGQALANQPYTAYTGPIAAGQSQLQGKAFGGLGSLQTPTATTAGSFTGQAYEPLTAQQLASGQMPTLSSPTNVVQQYMNPYLKGALAPQYEAARRQADIQQQNLQGQYTKAGAYGGGRQAIAEAELQRGLLDRMSGITGQGYEQAYNQASNLFNQDRGYGLQALQGQMNAGTAQRGIESEGIAADIAQFETERDYPYKQLQYQQSMLQGLPLETQTYSYTEPSGIQKLAGAYGDVEEGLDLLSPYAPQAPQAPQGPTSQQQAANYKVIYNSYLGSGMNRTEAAARAVYDITTDPGQKAVMKQQMISQGIKI